MSFIAGYLMGLSENGTEKPKLETLVVTSNGVYYPPTDADGYNVVIVDVPTEADYDNYMTPHGVKTENYTVEIWADDFKGLEGFEAYNPMVYCSVVSRVIDEKIAYGAKYSAVTGNWGYWTDENGAVHSVEIKYIKGYSIDKVDAHWEEGVELQYAKFIFDITFTYTFAGDDGIAHTSTGNTAQFSF